MERPTFEEICEKFLRHKKLRKRKKIIRKRVKQWEKNNKTLLKRLKSKGKEDLGKDLKELQDLSEVNYEIGLSMSTDQYQLLEEDISFETEVLEELSSATMDQYFARQYSAVAEREEALTRAEAAQARIIALLDAMG